MHRFVVLSSALLALAACDSSRSASAFEEERISESLDRAARLQEGGRPLQAAAELGAAADRAPDNAQVRYRLGELYQSQRLWDAAEAEYRRALSLEPNADVAVGLADLLRSQNRVGEAISRYRSALDLDPRAASAAFGLCEAQVSIGDFKAALEDCRLGVELNPQDVATRRRLGLALLRLERFQEAAEVLLDGADVSADERAEILRTLPESAPN